MRRAFAAAAVLLLGSAGCSFGVGASPGDGGDDDAPPATVTVGFAQATSIVDEQVGALAITVALSAPSTEPVTVGFAFTDDTAFNGADYTANAGVLTFTPGETALTISAAINADLLDESDETFTVALAAPVGAELGTSTHVVTISANLLPRVSVTTLVASGTEDTSTTVVFSLDQAAAADVSVTYKLAGTASAADLGLAGTEVITFAAGTLTEQRALGVVDDQLDEDAETVEIHLEAPVGVVILTPMATYTIDDDDATPTISFDAATTTLDEASVTLMIDVSLSAVSGRAVTLPFSLVAVQTTATSGTDFTILSTTPITIAAGTQTVQIALQINEDTASEPAETIGITLETPTNAVVGATPTHVITILNDDPYCLGTGLFTVCAPNLPTVAGLMPAVLNTDGAVCTATGPIGWQTPAAQPDACFLYATSVTMSQNTVIIGSRPLVIVATGSITVSNTIDVSSHRGGSIGPGSPSASCSAFVQDPAGSNGAGGGAGGSFMSKGGNGGVGNAGNQGGISAAADATAPVALRAGCHGQRGGNSNGNAAGVVGRGGGAIYLLAGGTITVTGAINASGSSGSAGGDYTGGSGAGTGGMIMLHAATIVAAGGTLIANGGGGAAGGDNNNPGAPGFDPSLGTPTTPAAGGNSPGGGGNGGDGFAGATAATNGASQGSGNGGGGGGGGGGYIRASAALTGATVSAGRVDAP